MQPIQLRFRYTEAEYLNAARLLNLGETAIIVRLAVFFLILLLAGIGFTIIAGFLLPIWSMVAFTLLLAAVSVYRMFVDIPRRYFRGNPNMADEFLLTFSSEGVWVRTTHIDSKLAWSLYTKVLENSSMYVIVYGKDARMMTAVPKRVFRNAQEEVEFRNLLRQHVDSRLPLTTPSLDDRIPEYVPSGSEPPDWR